MKKPLSCTVNAKICVSKMRRAYLAMLEPRLEKETLNYEVS